MIRKALKNLLLSAVALSALTLGTAGAASASTAESAPSFIPVCGLANTQVLPSPVVLGVGGHTVTVNVNAPSSAFLNSVGSIILRDPNGTPHAVGSVTRVDANTIQGKTNLAGNSKTGWWKAESTVNYNYSSDAASATVHCLSDQAFVVKRASALWKTYPTVTRSGSTFTVKNSKWFGLNSAGTAYTGQGSHYTTLQMRKYDPITHTFGPWVTEGNDVSGAGGVLSTSVYHEDSAGYLRWSYGGSSAFSASTSHAVYVSGS